MPGPAATVGSMHICPMLNPGVPPPPHVGGPVVGPGISNVLIEGKPASVMGDMCTCAGPPDTIVTAESNVLIGGKPAATVGSVTAHGGSITVGAGTVLIGTGASAPTVVAPIKTIPFPKITPILKTMASLSGKGKQLKKAQAKQEAIREMAENNEGEPKIYGIRIAKKDSLISESMVSNTLTIKARVQNIDDGQSVTFKVTIPPVSEEDKEQVVELLGTVQDKEVFVDWTPEKKETNT